MVAETIKYSSNDKSNKSQNISFYWTNNRSNCRLGKDLRVVHICFDPIFDSYSSEMWPLKTIIGNNSLEYTLKKNSLQNWNYKNCLKPFYRY